MGPPGLWRRHQGDDLASLRPPPGPCWRQASGPGQPEAASIFLLLGAQSDSQALASVSPALAVSCLGSHGHCQLWESGPARLCPQGPAEGDRHRVQSLLPAHRPGCPGEGKWAPEGPRSVSNTVLGTQGRGAPGAIFPGQGGLTTVQGGGGTSVS